MRICGDISHPQIMNGSLSASAWHLPATLGPGSRYLLLRPSASPVPVHWAIDILRGPGSLSRVTQGVPQFPQGSGENLLHVRDAQIQKRSYVCGTHVGSEAKRKD